MFDEIEAFQYVAIRLPSDTIKVEQIKPNTLISLGKYGSFHSNHIIGRPYYLTYEILARSDQEDGRELRIVRASEIHAETILEEAEPSGGESISTSTPVAGQFDEYGLLASTDKSNINISDDPTNQKLTYEEIEALKSNQMSNPRELIDKIMANHSQLDRKTFFSLAKYTLRKQKKYMKRFTVLPLDVATLTTYMMEEKDFSKVMEARNETLGLMCSWANIHAAGTVPENDEPRCRYLLVDDTGGLVVAAVAERMGILHHHQQQRKQQQQQQQHQASQQPQAESENPGSPTALQDPSSRPRRPRYEHRLATSNTITLVHPNQQPNLSILRYFSFDQTQQPPSSDPSPHPLHTNLHTLSWLQLLQPKKDSTYESEPPARTPQELNDMKANHRSNYYRKRRRWARSREIVNTARAGGFDGLIIATYMDPTGVLKHLVPLLRGGAQVVVYSAHIEPVMDVCDAYSTARRTAYLQELQKRDTPTNEIKDEKMEDGDEGYVVIKIEGEPQTQTQTQTQAEAEKPATEGVQLPTQRALDDPRFPVDPTLLLVPTVHHSCARPWQVLPGRTHPLMMGKGGAEGGYVLVSTRVIPVEGVLVQARGKQGRAKKRSTIGQGLDGEASNGYHGQIDGDRGGTTEEERAAKRWKTEE